MDNVAAGVTLGLLICAVSVAYPVWPFQRRWQALASGLLLIAISAAEHPATEPSARLTSNIATSSTNRPLPPVPCADQKACDEANRIAYSSPKHKALIALDGFAQPADHVKLDGFSWEKGGFGVVLVASFHLKNGLPVAVKDIDVTCEVAAASGTVLGSASKTLYQRIPAKGAKRIQDFDVGFINSQAARASCRVTKVVPVLD